MAETRIERDSMGPVNVPAERYWGAQTERSRANFRIGGERMPLPLIRALALQKKAAALANIALGQLDRRLGAAIAAAAQQVIDGQHDDEFPLVVWQTGSGTQTNMNMNEVIANLANEALGGKRGAPEPRSSERSRQSRAILERQFPDRDAHRRRARDPRPPAARAAKAARCARRQGARIRRHRQDRPDPSAGRDAVAALRRVRRLPAPGRARHRAHRGVPAAALSLGARRHRGRHRPQRTGRICRSLHRRAQPPHPIAVRLGTRQVRGAGGQ